MHLLLSVLVFTVKKITQETISGRKTSLFDVKVKRGRRYCYRLKQIPISRRRFRKQQLINTTCVGGYSYSDDVNFGVNGTLADSDF